MGRVALIGTGAHVSMRMDNPKPDLAGDSSRLRALFAGQTYAGRATVWGLLVACGASQAISQGPEEPQSATLPQEAFVNTAELAEPNAQEVLLDLPSALHWSRHQRGTLGPWIYVLYPDGTAKILDGTDRPLVMASLSCVAGKACDIAKADGSGFVVPVGTGDRPAGRDGDDLDSVATYLAKWILAGTAPPPPPPPPPVVEPKPQAPIVDPVPVSAAADADATLTDAEAETDADGDLSDADAEAALAEEQLAAEAEQSASFEDEPVCPEEDSFLPGSCAQPTEPLRPRTTQPIFSPPAPRAESPQEQPASPQADRAPAPAEEPASNVADRFIDRYNINCSITGSTSLAFLNTNADERGPAKPRASLGCSARLTERLSVRLSMIGYANPKEQESWDPDYTYAFTYRVNENLSLGYSNYSARFGAGGSPVSDLLKGKLRANYKLPPFKLPNDKSVHCNASLGLPKITQESLNLSCGYAVTKKLRVSGTAYFYAPGGQGTYQPDYSYTASYRVNDDWLLSYNNYSNNRWPWNKGEAPGPGIFGGSLSLTYKFKF